MYLDEGDTIFEEVMDALTHFPKLRRIAIDVTDFPAFDIYSMLAELPLDEVIVYYEQSCSYDNYCKYRKAFSPNEILDEPDNGFSFVDMKQAFKVLYYEQNIHEVRDALLADCGVLAEGIRERHELERYLSEEFYKKTNMSGRKPPKVKFMLMPRW